MQKYLLITGTIAYGALVKTIDTMKDMDIEIMQLHCTVAALMSTDFIARGLHSEASLSGEEIIVIPGLCKGPLQPIMEATGCKVVKGPKDLKELPAFLKGDSGYSKNSDCQMTKSPIRILAEIVDAPQMSLKQIMDKSLYYRENGADIIDIGGDTDQPFPNLKKVIKALKKEGFRVSMDSHQKEDILAASQAGVDLVLSLTSDNISVARELSCPVVVIPDDDMDLHSLYNNMEKLNKWNVPYIVDPLLPPLTFGLAAGVGRYLKVRQAYPDCQMLMGLCNVTELMDADSIGMNALMVGIAGELSIHYILTTEASHRTHGSVREISLACQLIHQAMVEERLPKHMDDRLLTIKDPAGNSFAKSEILEMHQAVRDKNYRIFVDDQIYIFNAHSFYSGSSAQELFLQLAISDAKHAFYLGRELDKAEIALRLGKKYVQDDPLRWGYFNKDQTNERGSFNDH